MNRKPHLKIAAAALLAAYSCAAQAGTMAAAGAEGAGLNVQLGVLNNKATINANLPGSAAVVVHDVLRVQQYGNAAEVKTTTPGATNGPKESTVVSADVNIAKTSTVNKQLTGSTTSSVTAPGVTISSPVTTNLYAEC